jgi:hypothetical protein
MGSNPLKRPEEGLENFYAHLELGLIQLLA